MPLLFGKLKKAAPTFKTWAVFVQITIVVEACCCLTGKIDLHGFCLCCD